MSTDRAIGGAELDCSAYREDDVEVERKWHKDDVHDDMLDKLRSDDFKGLVSSANNAHKQQERQMDQLCLGSDGSVTKADPLSAYAHLGKQRAAAGQGHEQAQAPEPSEDDELRRLRAARVAAMQQEQSYRSAGHGKLRELENTADFIGVVLPRERAVVLLSDSTMDKEAPEVMEALEDLAKRHVEAQFCHLELEKATILSHILDLDAGLPVVFVLKHGQVKSSLPPGRLFEFSSASSPKFKGHLATLLRRAGAIGSGADDANSDSGNESEERDGAWRRRR